MASLNRSGHNNPATTYRHAERATKVWKALSPNVFQAPRLVSRITGLLEAQVLGYLHRLSYIDLAVSDGTGSWKAQGNVYEHILDGDDDRINIDSYMRRDGVLPTFEDVAMYHAWDVVSARAAVDSLIADGVLEYRGEHLYHRNPKIPLSTPAIPGPFDEDNLDNATNTANDTTTPTGSTGNPTCAGNAGRYADILETVSGSFFTPGFMPLHILMKRLKMSKASIDNILGGVPDHPIRNVYVDLTTSTVGSIKEAFYYTKNWEVSSDGNAGATAQVYHDTLLNAENDAITEIEIRRLLAKHGGKMRPSDFVYQTDEDRCSLGSVNRVIAKLLADNSLIKQNKSIRLNIQRAIGEGAPPAAASIPSQRLNVSAPHESNVQVPDQSTGNSYVFAPADPKAKIDTIVPPASDQQSVVPIRSLNEGGRIVSTSVNGGAFIDNPSPADPTAPVVSGEVLRPFQIPSAPAKLQPTHTNCPGDSVPASHTVERVISMLKTLDIDSLQRVSDALPLILRRLELAQELADIDRAIDTKKG